jgi:hypothetical protein
MVSWLEERRAFLTGMQSLIHEAVHPAGAATIHHWINDALVALDGGDLDEVERLKKAILAKIELETVWAVDLDLCEIACGEG